MTRRRYTRLLVEIPDGSSRARVVALWPKARKGHVLLDDSSPDYAVSWARGYAKPAGIPVIDRTTDSERFIPAASR